MIALNGGFSGLAALHIAFLLKFSVIVLNGNTENCKADSLLPFQLTGIGDPYLLLFSSVCGRGLKDRYRTKSFQMNHRAFFIKQKSASLNDGCPCSQTQFYCS